MSSTETPSDDDKLAAHAEHLIDGLVAHVPGWVRHTVETRAGDAAWRAASTELDSATTAALESVSALLRTDIDEQRLNPLAVIRELVVPITGVLEHAGVPFVQRDPDAERIFPHDRYDLTPGGFVDIHPELHMPGLAWGAAKAHVHIQRRRAEGQR